MSSTLVELMCVAPAGEDRFVGQPERYGALGIYGGHFVGQATAAGLATVDETKLTHSLHGYFLNAGDPEQPINYAVTRLREGRGAEVRAILATQGERPVFHMTASYKRPEAGDEHQPTMPDVDSPETIAGRNDGIQFNPPPVTGGRAEMLMASPHFLQPEFIPDREPYLQVWIRCTDTSEISDRDAQTVLAFFSDATLMFNSVIPHGLPFQTHRLTSLDHAAWFHRPAPVSEWLLFDQRSSAAADGRGMNHGQLYTRDGQLVMTLAQESMLRRIPPPPQGK